MSSMTEKAIEQAPSANLQTAQNRMFPFVSKAMKDFGAEDHHTAYLQDPAMLAQLFKRVREQLFDLLNIPAKRRVDWHLGVADSGKRTIEVLVNYLCIAEAGKNAILDTENYVGFNKFSAATALEKQKSISFDRPFAIELGQALTANAGGELDQLSRIFEQNRYQTLWLAWNSTSTGVREDMAEIVRIRNQAQSNTLLIADAASLRLFSNDWLKFDADNLPDIFFFSLRKQGLPYEGPNDEFHQAQNSGALIVFNTRALEVAKGIDASPIYDSPRLQEFLDEQITQGEQRANHVKHLLKLNCALDHMMAQQRQRITPLDDHCKAVQSKIQEAFPSGGNGAVNQFSLFSDPAAQSDSAYILKVPKSTSAKRVISELKEKGVLISACMHPKMATQNYVRFAFYPGNTPEEVESLLKQIRVLSEQ